MSNRNNPKIETATEEIDVPLVISEKPPEIEAITKDIDIPPSPSSISAPTPETVPSDTVNTLERDRWEHQKSIDRWGFYLLAGSVGVYFVIYILLKKYLVPIRV